MFAGFVAFIIGSSEINLYSPNGKCQHKLTPNIPDVLSVSRLSVLGIINEKIVVCGGSYNLFCYLYDVVNYHWSVYSTSQYSHSEMPGVFHNGKFYLSEDTHPEVFDPSTKTWSTWAISPESPSYACLVSWKDVILQIGGLGMQIYQYDPSTNTWTNLNAPAPPNTLYYMSCLVLPNMNVLIAAPNMAKTVTAYNVTSNTWVFNINTEQDVYYSSLLLLGARAFIVSYHSNLIECYYNNQSVSVIDNNFSTIHAYYPGVIAVPDAWFSYLPGGCIGVI